MRPEGPWQRRGFLGGITFSYLEPARAVKEEKCDGDWSSGEGKRAPHGVISLVFLLLGGGREDRLFFSFVISFVVSFVYSSFSPVGRVMGARRQGHPARIDRGQDKVM